MQEKEPFFRLLFLGLRFLAFLFHQLLTELNDGTDEKVLLLCVSVIGKLLHVFEGDGTRDVDDA